MMNEDVQFLLATRRGSDAAARELWARHANAALAAARSVLRDESAAHDAVQEVFCRILSLPDRRLRAVADVRAWLCAAARRQALNHVRGEVRRRSRERSAATAPRPAPTRNDAVSGAIDTLPDDLRELVLLKHAAALTFDQIAIVLSANRNTVASRYRTAMDKLRGSLAAPTDVEVPCG